MEIVDRDLLVGADRHDLLREHVERVARDRRLLDRTVEHPPGDHGRLEQVGAELREDPPLRDRAELVPRAADALQPASDGLRRLDLNDQVDRAHVDPELERRRCDQARDLALLQQLLDLDALFARDRAVVGAGDLLLGQVVQPQGEPLGEAAVVDEDDRRAVRADELEDLRVDRGPDRLLLLGLAHVVERHDDGQVELLRATRVDELDLAPARDEAADLLQRPLGRREPDPLDRSRGLSPWRVGNEPVQSLDAQREVGAALRAGHGVHLVQDQRADGPEDLSRTRREQQEQRLRGRDQDVRRLAQHRGALLLRRVAGAHRHAQLRAEPGERPAQVPLDVVVERLQRRDVEQAQALPRLRVEPVDPVEEGRERLPRPGRRLDQRVLAARDRRPPERLRRRGLGKGRLEPGTRLGRKRRERIHLPDVSIGEPMPETPEELYARAAGGLRMPPVQDWETFPFEGEMRPRALQPPVAEEQPRHGAGGVDCSAAWPHDDDYLWTNEHWRLWAFDRPTGLPLIVLLESREHYAEPGDLPDELAAELGSCSRGSSARSAPSARSAVSTCAAGATAASTSTGGSSCGRRACRS